MGAQIKLAIENVSKDFIRNDEIIQAVFEANMNIKTNEFIVLVGPSGCGKSTLLHMVAGLIRPTSGKILLEGKEVVGLGQTGQLYSNNQLFTLGSPFQKTLSLV